VVRVHVLHYIAAQITRATEYRFEGSEVYVRREPITGDVVRSRRPDSWAGFFALDATTEVPADFMTEADRSQGEHARNPFESNKA
jgi:antitoxin VapB